MDCQSTRTFKTKKTNIKVTNIPFSKTNLCLFIPDNTILYYDDDVDFDDFDDDGDFDDDDDLRCP